MFSSKPSFSKIEIESFFLSMKGFSQLGYNLLDSIATVMNDRTTKKKLASVLKKIHSRVKDHGDKVEDCFLEFNFINNLEHMILSNSSDLKESLGDIIELKRSGNIFNKTVRSLFLTPVIMISMLIIGIYNIQPKILEFVDFGVNMAKMTTGTVLDIEIPFFLHSQDNLLYALFIFLASITSIVLTYLYLSKNKPQIIYKFFAFKAYDDMPLILDLMHNMSKVGVPTHIIFDNLSDFIEPEGLRPMLREMSSKIKNNDHFNPVLDSYNIPYDLVNIVSNGENTGSLWDVIPNIISYSKEKAKLKSEFLLRTTKQPLIMLTYSLIIGALLQMFLLMITVTTSISSGAM
jgi:type II secretory pathway component PulF